jgi:cyclic beta-1,2-glucan synthetase
MYRVALESILGVTVREGHHLAIRPCIPSSWPGFKLDYRLPDGRTVCEIVVSRGGGPSGVEAGGLAARIEDGAALVALPSDGGRHRIEVMLGTQSEPGSLTRTPAR